MADTPNIRFKGFSDNWVRQKLGEISSSYSGGTPKVGKSEYYGGAIPFIRSGKLLRTKQSYLSQKMVLKILPRQWLRKAISFMPYMVRQVGK